MKAKANTATKRIGIDRKKGSKRMIDVKEAANAAAEYFSKLYSGKQYSDLLLEEVELSEDEKHWLITLSYAYKPAAPPSASALDLFSKQSGRKYKIFKIDAATGNVEAMKIRSLN